LVEIVRAQTTSPETADALAALASRWGKTPVVVKDTPGFLANRVARPFYLEALRLLEEGAADVRCIDDCITAAGFPMGPFALMDLIGNDVNLATSESVFRGLYYDPRFRPSPLQREMVDANLLGRKTGAGFYDYKTDPPTPRDFGFETPCYDVHDQKNKPKEVFVYGKSDNLAPIVAALRGKGVKIKKEPPLLADEREICAIFYGNAALAAGGGETADRHSMRVLLDESEIGDIDWPIRNPGIDRDEMWARVEKGELAASPSADNIFVAVDGFADIEAIRNERQMYHPRGFIKFPVDALAIAGPSRAATDAACLLHAAGVKRVYNISDEPGLVVLRTAAMLAAAAINAAKRGIAEYQDKFSMAYPQGLLMEIDEAMCAGFNWPSGPREWGNKLGDYGNRVKETLEGLAEFYGEERYRAALSVYRK
jgi:3-hydroxybutyryl-CoA dehydrogenase